MCSAKRTRVIDDEADYFATDSNQWLTRKQRSALSTKEAEVRAVRHAPRRGRSRQVTLDFAGRRVIEDHDSSVMYAMEDDAGDVEQPSQRFNPDDFTVDLVNPNTRLSSAPQVSSVIDRDVPNIHFIFVIGQIIATI